MEKKEKKGFLALWISIIIISLCVAPAFALGERDENWVLIGVMGLAPIVLLCNLNRIYWEDFLLGVFCVLLLLIPNWAHPERMRWSTVLYTVMFCMNFVTFLHLLRKRALSPVLYEKILRYIIFAYMLVLIVQQICVLTGLPIFNVRNYNLDSPWKLNSLSAEPSHSSRIIVLLAYSWLCVKEVISGKKYDVFLNLRKDKWLWLAILYPLLTMGSGTAFTLMPILALKILSRETLVRSAIVIVGGIILLSLFEIPQLERSKRFIKATISLDIDKINDADASAAFRVVPLIVCAERLELLSTDGLFGNGIDSTSAFMYKYLKAAPKNWTGGGILAFWLEYGFILFIIFTYFSWKVTSIKGDITTKVVWFVLIFIGAVNSQMTWLAISLLVANKYFKARRNPYIMNPDPDKPSDSSPADSEEKKALTS